MMYAMRKASVLSILFVVVLLGVAVSAEAQQPAKEPRIGFLTAGSHSTIGTRIEALRRGLRELGYIEEKTLS